MTDGLKPSHKIACMKTPNFAKPSIIKVRFSKDIFNRYAFEVAFKSFCGSRCISFAIGLRNDYLPKEPHILSRFQ